MSKGITLQGLDVAGGKQLGGGQTRFRINGVPVVLLGDPIQSHGNSPHNNAVMVEGSSLFRIGGVPVVLEGHKASCGHVTTGQALFRVAG